MSREVRGARWGESDTDGLGHEEYPLDALTATLSRKRTWSWSWSCSCNGRSICFKFVDLYTQLADADGNDMASTTYTPNGRGTHNSVSDNGVRMVSVMSISCGLVLRV
jgi:hypothetical protein